MDEEAITSSVQIEELLPAPEIIQLIECPICNEIPALGPVWLCIKGHNVCDNCRTQLSTCGLCREPFSGGRNFFMESIVQGSKLTCPYSAGGCGQVVKGSAMKQHVDNCDFGPKLKWIAARDGVTPAHSVSGGTQNGVRLYIMRAPHMGSITPGKVYEYCPPGASPDSPRASLSWGGGERFKQSYEVLVAKDDCVKWVSSSNGELVAAAVRGGTSEGGEPLYIGRVQYGGDLINGKIHPSHGVCYIGVDIERAFPNYEILVTQNSPRIIASGGGGSEDDAPAYYS